MLTWVGCSLLLPRWLGKIGEIVSTIMWGGNKTPGAAAVWVGCSVLDIDESAKSLVWAIKPI